MNVQTISCVEREQGISHRLSVCDVSCLVVRVTGKSEQNQVAQPGSQLRTRTSSILVSILFSFCFCTHNILLFCYGGLSPQSLSKILCRSFTRSHKFSLLFAEESNATRKIYKKNYQRDSRWDNWCGGKPFPICNHDARVDVVVKQTKL